MKSFPLLPSNNEFEYYKTRLDEVWVWRSKLVKNNAKCLCGWFDIDDDGNNLMDVLLRDIGRVKHKNLSFQVEEIGRHWIIYSSDTFRWQFGLKKK